MRRGVPDDIIMYNKGRLNKHVRQLVNNAPVLVSQSKHIYCVVRGYVSRPRVITAASLGS